MSVLEKCTGESAWNLESAKQVGQHLIWYSFSARTDPPATQTLETKVLMRCASIKTWFDMGDCVGKGLPQQWMRSCNVRARNLKGISSHVVPVQGPFSKILIENPPLGRHVTS